MTVLARAFEDAVAADIAGMVTGSVVEGWPAAAAPSVELAVFGAHLLGQPLEHQLTALGARGSGPRGPRRTIGSRPWTPCPASPD